MPYLNAEPAAPRAVEGPSPATSADTSHPSSNPSASDDPECVVGRTTVSSRRSRRRGRPDSPGRTLRGSPPTSRIERPPALIPPPEAFRILGLEETGLDAVAALGFENPTPIQAAALPLLLQGTDVVGIAQTGTGKTLAFGLPLARSIRPSSGTVQALVLVPTRELARQVAEAMEHLGRFYGFTTHGLFGGRSLGSDLAALNRGVQVIVGTPGRVIDHLNRRTLSLADVGFAVLDEADQMLDIGFARDIDFILRATPQGRQTALFSATMPESIGRLVHRYMRHAERVSVISGHETAAKVSQYFYHIPEREKFLVLRRLCDTAHLGRSLVFRRTRAGVDRLTLRLRASGVSARAIHGDLRQSERDRVLADFRCGRLEFLIATNVAARGLDIPDIEHVINYDVPQNPDEYIHRIGRTARAGKTGSAVTFVGEWEFEDWDRIVDRVGADDLQHRRLEAN